MRRPPPRPRLSPGVALAVGLLLTAAPVRAEDRAREARSTLRPTRKINPTDLRRTGGPARLPSSIQKLRETLESIWAGRALRRGVTAVYVVDARTGQALFRVHEDEKVNPASNVKLVSTATVLDSLGPDWRFRTRLFAATPVDGVIDGGVYLRGTYDPTLGVPALRHLAEDLAAAGVERIDGDVVLSADPERDTLASGSVRVKVRGRRAGKSPEVSVTPPSSFVVVENEAQTRRRGRSRVRVETRVDTGDDGTERLVVKVTGRIRRGSTRNYRERVEDRSNFTGQTLRGELVAAGIEVTGDVRTAELAEFVGEAAAAGRLPVVQAEHASMRVASLVSRVNKRSINWLADSLVMAAGAHLYGGAPSMDKGIRAMNAWLEKIGIDPDDVTIDTGSGLSYQTELTAHQIVKVLRHAGGYARDTPNAETFRASLAVGGVDGTLRRRFRGSDSVGEVLAKTGTLTSVIALSGFVTTDEGHELCFAIVTNGNRHRRRNDVRREHETMVEALHAFLEQGGLPEPGPGELGADEAIASMPQATEAQGDPSAEAAADEAFEALDIPDEGDDEAEAEPLPDAVPAEGDAEAPVTAAAS